MGKHRDKLTLGVETAVTRLVAQDVLGACMRKTHYILSQKEWLLEETDAELSSKDE